MLLLFRKLSFAHPPPTKPHFVNHSSFSKPRSSLLAMAAAPSVVAEYAKSNRSSCKICKKTIASGSLRLGLCSKDPRGFDLLKWYHVDCFPTKSQPMKDIAEIKGFASLKDVDKDVVRNLEAAASSDTLVKKDHKTDHIETDGLERSANKAKTHDKDDNESESFDHHGVDELEDHKGDLDGQEQKAKKAKQSGDSMETSLEIPFSFSDIKNNYKDATLLPNWKSFSTVIFREREDGLHDSEKIAAFDFDGCLANTSVKRTGADAWSLMYPSIPAKLQSLYDSGYKLVIFTNESNIERWKNKRQAAVDSKLGRLDKFISHVKVPIQVFIACGLGKNKDQTEDPFRKPKPGMWRLMEEHFNSGISIDMIESFYVGDAAGRANDHSDADIKFAEVIGLKFHVPEDFFGA